MLLKHKPKTFEEIYKNWLKNREDNEENFINFAVNVDWRIGQELEVVFIEKYIKIW